MRFNFSIEYISAKLLICSMLFGPNDKLERLRLLSEKAKLANLFLTKKVLMKVYQLCSLNSISRSLHFDLNIKIRTL